MQLEKERKFLVDKSLWETMKKNLGLQPVVILQYSSPPLDGFEFRFRKVVGPSTQHNFIIKKFVTLTEDLGRICKEYVFPIELNLIDEIFEKANEAGKLLTKQRYKIPFTQKGTLWTVDEFTEPNLLLAEVEINEELFNEAGEEFLPLVCTKEEVTGDKTYWNILQNVD